MTAELSCSDLAARLADRVDDVVPALLRQARRAGGYWCVGSVDDETGNSLYVHRSGTKAGKWSDAATGKFGDLIDLAAASLRMDARAARAWAVHFLGVAEKRPKPKATRPNDDGIKDARTIWASSKSAIGTIAEIYLRSRGIAIPPPASLRFNGALPYSPSGLLLPALICGVSGEDRRVHAVQRIFLRTDGAGKAAVAQPKLSRGPMRDGAVRMAPATAELGLAEGPETALSAQQLHRIPTWAALGRRMDAIKIPETVERLIIFADNGEPGHTAAERAAAAHQRAGRKIEIVFPTAGAGDFNDVLRAEQVTS